jgi:V/A-type H+/Na+-transporting ATPase subunit D
MPDIGEVAATRVALLELRDERRLVQEGYELLDEKRVLLATEILRELRAHEAARTALDRFWLEAREALAGAVEIHGFEDLTVEPPCLLDSALLRQAQRNFLGLRLAEASLDSAPCLPASPPVRSTPELRRCSGAFRQLTMELVAQAARAASLRRLVEEYRRTERRARALENVLLPEIDHSVKFIEEQLDAVDQEEAVRVRNATRGR